MSGRGPFQDTPSIRVEALTLARGERVLIEGLSFSAGAGDYVELRGANGAGKTTLLRALAG
ncbi:MAG: ATP-binding cassette domain-containing protein, partial [Hyphomonadaceae bacterium]|nr:ATP-binding cassette domain-containing protein [Hyphomonadaceae bacterium]